MTRLDLYIDLNNNRWGELNGEPIEIKYKNTGYHHLDRETHPKTDEFRVWLVIDGKQYDITYEQFVFGMRHREDDDVYQDPIEFMPLAEFGLKKSV